MNQGLPFTQFTKGLIGLKGAFGNGDSRALKVARGNQANSDTQRDSNALRERS